MRFAEISMRTMFKLLAVEIDDCFISGEAMDEVREILNLTEKTASELTAIRNTVVRTINEEFIEPAMEEKRMEEFRKYTAKCSGITAVIDSQLFKMGQVW